jgi:hypothetical protein
LATRRSIEPGDESGGDDMNVATAHDAQVLEHHVRQNDGHCFSSAGRIGRSALPG